MAGRVILVLSTEISPISSVGHALQLSWTATNLVRSTAHLGIAHSFRPFPGRNGRRARDEGANRRSSACAGCSCFSWQYVDASAGGVGVSAYSVQTYNFTSYLVANLDPVDIVFTIYTMEIRNPRGHQPLPLHRNRGSRHETWTLGLGKCEDRS